MRSYITRRKAPRLDHFDGTEIDPTFSLSRIVFEEVDLVPIGVLDENGEPIMAYERMDKIGFVRFPD